MERGSSVLSERDAAAVWHERLHRDKVSEETRREFDTWLAASPVHRQAYESVEGAWASLQQAAEAPSILALRHETALRLTRKTSGHTRPLRWVAAAAILIALGVGTLAVYPTDRPLLSSVLATLRNADHLHYQTATGERLAVSLPDGSQVMLDTQSELKLNFSPAERRVQLTRGQAFFEVAKDPKRPFVVATRNRQFVAVGTVFDVRLDDDGVKVTMLEGTVRVESAGDQPPLLHLNDSQNGKAGQAQKQDRSASSGAPPIATITAGEQLISDDAHHEDHVRAADPERDTSWRRGQIIFERARLADAITEINRYSERKIELGDESLADLQLSGAFATGRPTAFIEAVTTYFPVRVQSSDERKVVLSKRD